MSSEPQQRFDYTTEWVFSLGELMQALDRAGSYGYDIVSVAPCADPTLGLIYLITYKTVRQ